MKLLGLTVWIVSCLFVCNRAVDPLMRLNGKFFFAVMYKALDKISSN